MKNLTKKRARTVSRSLLSGLLDSDLWYSVQSARFLPQRERERTSDGRHPRRPVVVIVYSALLQHHSPRNGCLSWLYNLHERTRAYVCPFIAVNLSPTKAKEVCSVGAHPFITSATSWFCRRKSVREGITAFGNSDLLAGRMQTRLSRSSTTL